MSECRQKLAQHKVRRSFLLRSQTKWKLSKNYSLLSEKSHFCICFALKRNIVNFFRPKDDVPVPVQHKKELENYRYKTKKELENYK
jgi:hypothetical protein